MVCWISMSTFLETFGFAKTLLNLRHTAWAPEGCQLPDILSYSYNYHCHYHVLSSLSPSSPTSSLLSSSYSSARACCCCCIPADDDDDEGTHHLTNGYHVSHDDWDNVDDHDHHDMMIGNDIYQLMNMLLLTFMLIWWIHCSRWICQYWWISRLWRMYQCDVTFQLRWISWIFCWIGCRREWGRIPPCTSHLQVTLITAVILSDDYWWLLMTILSCYMSSSPFSSPSPSSSSL